MRFRLKKTLHEEEKQLIIFDIDGIGKRSVAVKYETSTKLPTPSVNRSLLNHTLSELSHAGEY